MNASSVPPASVKTVSPVPARHGEAQKPGAASDAKRWIAPWLAIVSLATLLGVALSWAPVFTRLDGGLYDLGIVSKASTTQPQPEAIVIIGLDDAFAGKRHVGMLPRDKLARLIDIVVQGRPAVIAIDWWLDSYIDGDHNPNGQDAQLRRALGGAKRAGVPILLAQVTSDAAMSIDNSRSSLSVHDTVIPYFGTVVAGVGGIDFPTDPDGVYRDLPNSSEASPSLSLLTATLYRQKIKRPLEARVRDRLHRESTPIDFIGGPGSIQINDATKVLSQPAIGYLMADKIVFIGATFPRSDDFLNSPFTLKAASNSKPSARNATAQSTLAPGSGAMTDRRLYGVEMLAQSTTTILNDAPRHSADAPAARFKVIVLALLLTGLVTVVALRGAVWGIVVAMLTIVFVGWLALISAREPIAFLGSHFWRASPTVLSTLLALAMTTAYRQMTLGRELRQVKAVFDGYVGDQILQQLGGKMPQLGGETWNIAVLFCDIEGFSALSESMRDDPERLLSTLNDHFQPLVKALQDRGGHVDNYVGDLVMALFGAPIPADSLTIDTRNAVWAAIDFIEIIKERNKQRRAAGEPTIEVGIGVHCGPAVVGNMGSQRKMHYTAIGDNVNLASRVESATRTYHTPLLVTEEVVQAFNHNIDQLDAAQRLEWEFVAETTVKGRIAPVRLYRPKV